MKILVSGFEPFGSDSINPSEEIIKRLPASINDKKILSIVIPVETYKCIDKLNEYIDTFKPDYILNIGQAGGRKGITVERVAINILDYRIPDNNNETITDKAIEEDGPAAYFSTLPIKHLVKRLNKENIEASVSNTAGTYLCNYVMYSMLHKNVNSNVKAGFVHVPYLKGQKIYQPEMELDTMVEAIKIIIDNIDGEEEVINGGKEC